jgi:hypothetical protein
MQPQQRDGTVQFNRLPGLRFLLQGEQQFAGSDFAVAVTVASQDASRLAV